MYNAIHTLPQRHTSVSPSLFFLLSYCPTAHSSIIYIVYIFLPLSLCRYLALSLFHSSNVLNSEVLISTIVRYPGANIFRSHAHNSFESNTTYTVDITKYMQEKNYTLVKLILNLCACRNCQLFL